MLRTIVGAAQDGKRIDKFLFLTYPEIPGAAIYKAFKNRDVKINGQRVKEQAHVHTGDEVTLHPVLRPLNAIHRHPLPVFQSTDIAYEDDALLVVLKPQGIPVQPVRSHDRAHSDPVPPQDPPCFEALVQAWWALNRSPLLPGFPALCHRLDRNTAGLLMFAKTEQARLAISGKLRHHMIRKWYHCLVAGIPQPPEAEVQAWLEKDAGKSRVYIHEHPVPGAVPIRTRYRLLQEQQELALLEVEIITGRTHQIRAQLARLGHPIVGDSKYGSNTLNRRCRLHRQALWACGLSFAFPPEGLLSEVAGKQITWLNPANDLLPSCWTASPKKATEKQFEVQTLQSAD